MHFTINDNLDVCPICESEKITQYDNKMYQGQTKIKQEGSNGKTRIVKKVKMLNGEVLSAYIVSSEEIKPAVNKIIVRGGKQSYVIRGDEHFELVPGESIDLAIEEIHSLQNPYDEPVKILEVQRGDILDENDIERLEDMYGRV